MIKFIENNFILIFSVVFVLAINNSFYYLFESPYFVTVYFGVAMFICCASFIPYVMLGDKLSEDQMHYCDLGLMNITGLAVSFIFYSFCTWLIPISVLFTCGILLFWIQSLNDGW